ncbi:acyl-CoA dehydrogenase family protein [Nocardia macrotermitis]|uniref:Acyl-CoA dehydrogenase FadE34 n=1 Tax=Nocardia macrotermitis TaxID=2585198 RepID=A0A7K0D355_9NOCA|nr:acyl-CoA dehydrogenase family protein [Nocardia macrotermitis]MQY20148.1 Acyl-CoA dehydrogenase FadE34 [Nocardia macrotermitis]
MNLELTPEQLALRDSVRRCLKAGADLSNSTSDARGHDSLAGLDLAGLLIPESHGGAGASMVDAGVVLEEIGRALDSGPWLSSSVAVPRVIARAGVTDSAATLLTAIANGSTTATIGLSGAHEPTVRATFDRPEPARHPDDPVTLDGSIAEIPDADIAQTLLVVARHGTNLGLFTVEIPTAGAEFEQLPSLSRPLCRATLYNAPARYLGEITTESLSAATDDILIATATDALGAAQALFDLTIDHTRTRRQFDRPIAAFQAVQHLCVDMYETIELTRGGVLHGLWAADTAPHTDHHLAAIRLKAFSAELATVAETAIQIFGGIGYTWEHPAHRYLERLLSWTAFLGHPDRYLREIGHELTTSIEPTGPPPHP